MAAWVHSLAWGRLSKLMESSASAGVYGLAALLHDQFFAYSIDMSTAAEEVRGSSLLSSPVNLDTGGSAAC